MSQGLTTEPIAELRQRKQSVIQIANEDGQLRTVQLDEMSDADRELAEKFGYNPVCGIANVTEHQAEISEIGIQKRVRLFSYVFIRC
jgi:hypothetical protein